MKGKGKDVAKLEWAPTPLDALHVAGAEDSQIWAQLDLRASALCDMLSHILEETPEDADDRAALEEKAKGEVAGDEMDMDDDDDDESPDADSDSEAGMSELDALLTTEEEDDSSDGERSEHELDLRDPDDDEDDSADEPPAKKPVGPKSALDDGFFSLADFNRETEAAEARGHSSGRLKDDSDDSDEDEDVDLFAAVQDGPEEVFDEDDLETTGGACRAVQRRHLICRRTVLQRLLRRSLEESTRGCAEEDPAKEAQGFHVRARERPARGQEVADEVDAQGHVPRQGPREEHQAQPAAAPRALLEQLPQVAGPEGGL